MRASRSEVYGPALSQVAYRALVYGRNDGSFELRKPQSGQTASGPPCPSQPTGPAGRWSVPSLAADGHRGEASWDIQRMNLRRRSAALGTRVACLEPSARSNRSRSGPSASGSIALLRCRAAVILGDRLPCGPRRRLHCSRQCDRPRAFARLLADARSGSIALAVVGSTSNQSRRVVANPVGAITVAEFQRRCCSGVQLEAGVGRPSRRHAKTPAILLTWKLPTSAYGQG